MQKAELQASEKLLKGLKDLGQVAFSLMNYTTWLKEARGGREPVGRPESPRSNRARKGKQLCVTPDQAHRGLMDRIVAQRQEQRPAQCQRRREVNPNGIKVLR